MSHYMQEIDVAREAAFRSARVCRLVQESYLATVFKTAQEPVTIADFASQAIISYFIQSHFPSDAVIAEEQPAEMDALFTSEQQKTIAGLVSSQIDRVIGPQDLVKLMSPSQMIGGRTWVVDPLDGTKGFLENRSYAIALALLVDNVPVVAFVFCPKLQVTPNNGTRNGIFYQATRGRGAFAACLDTPNELVPLHVSHHACNSKIQLIGSLVKAHDTENLLEQVATKIGTCEPIWRMDGQGKYGLLAEGIIDAYIRLPPRARPEKIWDHAAGALIAEEAGGKVTDCYGQPLDYATGRLLNNNTGLLATNRHIHSTLLEALQQLLPKEQETE